MAKLGVHHVKSSAYHPQTQGALERFHQTLKSMLRTYCSQHERDWDEGLPLVMFAARENVNESLGFSSNELVFGHNVRGPLKVVKEGFMGDPETPSEGESVLKYVHTFRTRLYDACVMAKAHLSSSQGDMKARYDKDARHRVFAPGDLVLMFLPVPGQPLKARFMGPYEVESRVRDLDYIIKTPDRRKSRQLCHINMLKAYHKRSPKPVCSSVSRQKKDGKEINSNPEVELDGDAVNEEIGVGFNLDNVNVLAELDPKLEHLTPSQKEDMKNLLKKYSDLFPDVPGQTNAITHYVDVGDAKPIKQHYYRVNPAKRAALDKEIDYMLENGIVEPSYSDWSSPCVLIPKPDKTWRFCTDYKKLNSVTKTYTFPIPRIDDCIDQIGGARFLTKLDLLKGYWQTPLSEEAREISAFTTPRGLYQYKVMPFGMKNSGATFCRMMGKVILNLEGTVVYIDDLCVYSDNWENHMIRLERLFERLRKYHLSVSLK